MPNERLDHNPHTIRRIVQTVERRTENRKLDEVGWYHKGENMVRKLALTAGFGIAMAFALNPQITSATPVGPHSIPLATTLSDGTLIQKVQMGPRCRHVRRECAKEFPVGSKRFHRCMRRHGC
jgi:hypothetical protein